MIADNLSAAEKAEVLREAYRKHAKELLAIEEAQIRGKSGIFMISQVKG